MLYLTWFQKFLHTKSCLLCYISATDTVLKERLFNWSLLKFDWAKFCLIKFRLPQTFFSQQSSHFLINYVPSNSNLCTQCNGWNLRRERDENQNYRKATFIDIFWIPSINCLKIKMNTISCLKWNLTCSSCRKKAELWIYCYPTLYNSVYIAKIYKRN